MPETRLVLLPEGQDTGAIVDDPEFTEVTNQGEVYTLYRVVRFTHEIFDHPQKWTHMANVVRVRRTALGVALLRVVDRAIDDAKVTLSGTGDQD